MSKNMKPKVEEYTHKEVLAPEEIQNEVLSDISAPVPPNFFEKAIVGVLLGFIFLLPLFFLPLPGFFVGFSKNLLLSSAVLSLTVLMLILWIKQGAIVLPKNILFSAVLYLIVVSSFSSFLSGSFSNSFFGSGSEITTTFELILAGLLFFLVAIFFKTTERLFYAISAVFFSSIVVFLFQIFHFVFPDATSFLGIAPDKTVNLVGNWGDLGIFSGIIVLLSLVTLEKFPNINTLSRAAAYVFLIVALFFHALVFSNNSWIILGGISFLISGFIFFHRAKTLPNQTASLIQKWIISPSLIVAIISFLFIFIGPSVNAKLFNLLNISPIQDVRPSFSGTYQVAQGLFSEKDKGVFFGVGPNRFFIPWQKYRPKEVNYTPWWGVDFNQGVGTIPSLAVTSGVLGILGWVAFLLLFLFVGIRAFARVFASMDALAASAAIASFVSALYLWVAASLNAVGVIPFILAFIFTGLFLATLSVSGSFQFREYRYTQSAGRGFTSVVVLFLLVGVSLALGYRVIERNRAFFAYHTAVIDAEKGNFEKAETGFQKAILLAPSDQYYRSFSALNSYQVEQLLLRKDLSPDELRSEFGSAFRASTENASKAIALDSMNYQNWIILGNVYSILVPLGIPNVSDDAYGQVKHAYEEAMKRNPFNPEIPYLLAKAALAKGLTDEAVGYLQKSIELKGDYSDAIILLSQITDGKGNPEEAIAMMEQGLSAFSFPDPAMFFQLGYLRYKNGDYAGAVSALEKAVQAIPEYSNAKYFLGLSYFELGRKEDALKEFSDIKRLNPERTDILDMIRNTEGGYAPLSSLIPENTPSSHTASTSIQDTSSTTKKDSHR
jgi:tetratricopeptide (TPR) repeat protein